MSKADPLAANDRIVIGSLETEFARLHSRYCSLTRAIPGADIYRNPRLHGHALPSVGEHVLRGTAAVEQTFGGITANLWDDPFEWTLPENLATVTRVVEYLEEVAATRQRAFASFVRDADLLKHIMLPMAETRPLVNVLNGTLVKAADYYGRALATLNLLADASVSEVAG